MKDYATNKEETSNSQHVYWRIYTYIGRRMMANIKLLHVIYTEVDIRLTSLSGSPEMREILTLAGGDIVRCA